ncbi:NUDIX domain-containing protein [Lysinibacillus sp. NPDC097195]|uniref:NUDIX domain-containing protein n=1 Tax=Lysinibacillus sp. NPDC097195 TaxID=3364141 RepID=UPI0038279B49
MIRTAVGAIVFHGNKFLIVQKTSINTLKGRQNINGEWDFIKGGVEERDMDINAALLRELQEETGSKMYEIVQAFPNKICFDFSAERKVQIGYTSQETTMFLVEFLGDIQSLSPNDSEISTIKWVDKDDVVGRLTHQDTKDYFIKYIM